MAYTCTNMNWAHRNAYLDTALSRLMNFMKNKIKQNMKYLHCNILRLVNWINRAILCLTSRTNATSACVIRGRCLSRVCIVCFPDLLKKDSRSYAQHAHIKAFILGHACHGRSRGETMCSEECIDIMEKVLKVINSASASDCYLLLKVPQSHCAIY